MTIRTPNTLDADRLVSLWREAGLRFDAATVAVELRSVLDRDDLVLVDVDDGGEIVGAVLGTFDGRRGWVNRLAVRKNMQGRGVGARLLAELERRLTALGCRKVNVLIEPENSSAAGFYARHGYQPDNLIFMEKHLAVPPRRELSPLLYDEPYVYVTAPGPPPSVPMFAAILEDESLTLVLTRADADAAGLDYSYVAARITLQVNSTLDEVGLTATVSRALADAGISCNVIAASAHDHLFVPWPRRHQALEILKVV
jgi:ribosomal protein S18 acetylase RimI-like enzyme